jgi:hypothetical protein
MHFIRIDVAPASLALAREQGERRARQDDDSEPGKVMFQ